MVTMPARTWRRVPAAVDRYEPSVTAVFFDQVAVRLRVPVRRLLEALLVVHRLTGSVNVTSTALAAVLGVCVDTARSRREELRRILVRALGA